MAWKNPDDKTTTSCPICGLIFDWRYTHACPPRVLRAIDAANTRAVNADDPELNAKLLSDITPPFARRLAMAEEMLGMAGDSW